MARLFADKMARCSASRGGGEPRRRCGTIAGKPVAGAEPDGYTVLVASNSMVVAQVMNPTPGLDIERDLQAMASVAPQAIIVVAAPDLPVTSLKELIALAASAPLNYCSPGTGSVPQLLLAHLFTALPNAKDGAHPVPGRGAGADRDARRARPSSRW